MRPTVVAAALKVAAPGPLQHVVPVQQVVGCWVRRDLRRWVLRGAQHTTWWNGVEHIPAGCVWRQRLKTHAARTPTLSSARYSFCRRLMQALLPIAGSDCTLFKDHEGCTAPFGDRRRPLTTLTAV